MPSRRSMMPVLTIVAVVLAVGIGGLAFKNWSRIAPYLSRPEPASTAPREANAVATAGDAEPTVEVTEEGLRLLKIDTVTTREFVRAIRNVGVIDFNQDLSTPVFPSYQGKIIQALVSTGDHVAKDQILYTVYSPDLLQAEATLIQTAGVLDLSNRNLARLRQSVRNGGGAQKDLDQAVSDQQTAVGAYESAKLDLHVYGKTDEEAERIALTRTVDPVLDVKSPFAGVITARNAAPGFLVQPGTAPAPYSVSNLGQIRMYVFVSEDEVPAVRPGLEVTAHVGAYPDRIFTGRITAVAAALDPNTRRLQVESQIPDPQNLLRPGMFAEMAIRLGAVRSASVPADAIVRLGDGTMTAWMTADERHFSQRVVKIGLHEDGFDQILDGLKPGERIVSDGAVYVSNIANANASP